MQEAKAIKDMTIGEIVADDYRTAALFEKHGIDFCCGGKIPLATICTSKAIDLAGIAREIADAKSTPVARSENYTEAKQGHTRSEGRAAERARQRLWMTGRSRSGRQDGYYHKGTSLAIFRG